MAISPPAPAQYWIHSAGATKGPFTVPQLQVKLSSGEATWGTKACPVGQAAWRPLHQVPGVIPDALRPTAAPVPTSPVAPLRTTPIKTRTPLPRWARRTLLGAAAAVVLVAAIFAIRSALDDSLDGFERGYGDTVLRHLDRPYEGAKWTQLKETASFAEMVSIGNANVTELHRIAGWDDNNLWLVNILGQVFQLRDGHWQFAAKPENAHSPRLRVLDHETVLVAGTHLFKSSPGNLADLGEVNQASEELFPADRGLIYSYRSYADTIRFADGVRTALKVDQFKEATVQRKDNTPLKEYLVGGIRHVRPVKPGVAFGVAFSGYGKRKLVRYEHGFWTEFSELPEKESSDLWLTGPEEAPHVVQCGKAGWVHVQPANGAGSERTLAPPPDSSPMNLIKVWGASSDKFWVMDEHGTVWELSRSESRVVVRGLRREDITFRDAWVSPTGAVFAITPKYLYRLD
jgi:hypothetical protein